MMDYRTINEAASMEQILAAYGISTDPRRHVALCPFHDDTKPSLHVYEHSFYCFACGAGGDVINFVQRIENIPAADAARKVLSLTNGECQRMDYRARRRMDEQKKAERKREMLFERKCDIMKRLQQLQAIIEDAEPYTVEWCDACLEYDRVLWEFEEIDGGEIKK